MPIRFRKAKDIAAPFIDLALRASAPLPLGIVRFFAYSVALLFKAYYFFPNSHARRTLTNLCRLLDGHTPRATYSRMMDHVAAATVGYARLMRGDANAVIANTAFDDESRKRIVDAYATYGQVIFVVPHTAGAVLAAARFGKEFPCVMLVRESKSKRRGQIMQRYFERLGPELLFVRRSDPRSVTRRMIQVLREGKSIIGSTDLARRRPDTLDVRVFGQDVPMPSWPARFSLKRGVPIVPCYIQMQGDRIIMMCGEPYVAKDLVAGTQCWASYFEEQIRRYPSDWLFMLEKRWSRIIAAAAQKSLLS